MNDVELLVVQPRKILTVALQLSDFVSISFVNIVVVLKSKLKRREFALQLDEEKTRVSERSAEKMNYFFVFPS